MIDVDELQLVIVADNETDTLSSIDNTEQRTEAAGLLDRLEPSFTTDGHPHTSNFDHLCCACHGFSVLATGHHDGRRRTVLFDVGHYGDIWRANAERLGIDLATIESIFSSHWHWVHSGGPNRQRHRHRGRPPRSQTPQRPRISSSVATTSPARTFPY